jgi:methionyl-tRNA formyltransferase
VRLAFMGTPDFAVPALRSLHAAGHDIAAVYCQPPRPAGRGQALRPSPVQAAAEALGLPVRSPLRLKRDMDAQAAFAEMDLDIAVVAAYGLILPEAMLAAPRRGCLNIHASLLPRWRGAAPIQAAILAGDAETGVTIMRMGARMLLRALDTDATPRPQPEDGATYAAKLTREDGKLDWARPATELDRRIRALNPWPGTFTTLDGTVMKILGADLVEAPSAPPGMVLDERLTIATGAGALRITRLQAPGRAAMDGAAFLRGRHIARGMVAS